MKTPMKCERYADCQLKEINKDEVINDKCNLPKIVSIGQALDVILTIATDKRGHVMFVDHVNWMELKFKGISKVARKAIKILKEE